MKRIFANVDEVPEELEARLIEATQRHWHELPDEVRDILIPVLSGAETFYYIQHGKVLFGIRPTPNSVPDLVTKAWAHLSPIFEPDAPGFLNPQDVDLAMMRLAKLPTTP